MPNAEKLIARMGNGQDLVDRFLVAVPPALCPTSAEVETATEYLSTKPDDSIKQTFEHISDCQQNQTTPYTFDKDAKQLLKTERLVHCSFVPPKSKQLDLIPSCCSSSPAPAYNLLSGHAENPIPNTIPLNTLQCAVKYIRHLEMQKHMSCEVS